MTKPRIKAETTKPKETATERTARLAMSADVNAACVVLSYSNAFGEQNINDLLQEAVKQVSAVQNGEMSGVEAMLISQSLALQSMFVNLARRAATQTGLPQLQTLTGLALKAQSACRSTLETLAEIKNPTKPTFVKQQNVAYQQQVNNGNAVDGNNATNTRTGARTEHSAQNSNELLTKDTYATMDARRTGTASAAHTQLAAVETVNRSQNSRG